MGLDSIRVQCTLHVRHDQSRPLLCQQRSLWPLHPTPRVRVSMKVSLLRFPHRPTLWLLYFRETIPRWPNDPLGGRHNRAGELCQALCALVFAEMVVIHPNTCSMATDEIRQSLLNQWCRYPLFDVRKNKNKIQNRNCSSSVQVDLLTGQQMNDLVWLPVAFEALLSAKERALDAHFQASRTLQCCLFAAIGCFARVLRQSRHRSLRQKIKK